MNKKVVLSVLATAVVASMAASAFAAPKTGLYIGGNVKKFYSNDTLINMTKDARATYKNELKTIGFKNLVYVNFKGQGATIQEMIDLGVKVAMADPLKQSDFLESYGVVQKDGTINGTEVPKVDPVPTGDLKVDSVSAINLKQIKVNFNTTVDAEIAGEAGYYTVSNNTVTNVAVSADKKSVVLTLGTHLVNQTGKVTVTVSGDIKSASGALLGDPFIQKDVSFTDTVLPTVTKVAATGNKKVVVYFSEPVKGLAATVPSNYLIDGQLFSATSVTLDPTAGEFVTIELATPLTAGAHTLTVKAATVEDYATFKNSETTSNFSVDAVTTAPTASVVSATTTQVVFKFDREIKGTPAVTFGGVTGTVQQDNVDKTKFTVTFAAGTIPNAGGQITIAKGLEDLYGNKTTEDIKLSFQPAFDTVKPTLVGMTASSETKIVAEFSEEIQNPTNTGTFVVKDKDGKVVAGTTVAFAKTDANKDIVTKAAITGTFDPAKGPFKVSISGVKDLAGNPIDAIVDKEVSVPDKTAPQIVGDIYADATNYKLAVNFSEKVDLTSATNLANYKYEISGQGIYSLPTGSNVSLDASGKTVVITFPASWKVGADTKTIQNVAKLYVSGVKDLANNTMVDIGKTVNVNVGETIAAVSSVEATAKDTLKVTLANTGSVPATLYAGDFIVKKGSENVVVKSATIADRVITLKLASDLPTNAALVTVETVATPVGTATGFGTAFKFTSQNASDKIAPSLVPVDGKLVTTGASVAIKFDEAIATSGSVAAQAFTVKDSNGTLLKPTTDYTAAVNGETITLTFTTSGLNDVVSVALSNNNVIEDAAHNLAADFTATVSADKVVVVPAPVQTTAPDVATIAVTNNPVGTNDTVVVSSLVAGDVVKVYDAATNGTKIGEATVAVGQTSATVTITQLGVASGSVWVTVTNTGKTESNRVEQTYSAE
ncbi:hypothetical protein ABE215_02290 [Brevibacillus parabrevis]|uniref:hypothetical protein n=1 Tax=Brevibacillus parabrevis TaxID=54914 RepID=UPI003D25FA6B